MTFFVTNLLEFFFETLLLEYFRTRLEFFRSVKKVSFESSIFRQCTSPLNGLGTRTRKRLPTREENNEALTSISSPMTDPNQLWVHQTQGAGPGRPKRTKSSPTKAAEYSIRTKCLAEKPAKVTRGLLVKSQRKPQRIGSASSQMSCHFFASLALKLETKPFKPKKKKEKFDSKSITSS